jgi:signal transduction histidine kinase
MRNGTTSGKSGRPSLPNDNLLVEWNEMYSIGVSGSRSAFYESLPPGAYKFRVAEVSVLGEADRPRSYAGYSSAAALLASAVVLGRAGGFDRGTSALSVRYLAWHRMRRAMIHLEQQRALERERLRIAQDIHDDLGARVTEISLLSGMAKNNSRVFRTSPGGVLPHFPQVPRPGRGALRNRLGGQSRK